jgi:hypothetical protein
VPIPDRGAPACAARDDGLDAPHSPANFSEGAGGIAFGRGVAVGWGGGASDNRVFYTVVPDRHAACIRRLSWCGRLRQAPALSGSKRRAGHNRKLGA